MKIPIVDDLLQLFVGKNCRPTCIMLTSIVMIVTWLTAGTQAFYHRHLGHLLPADIDPAAAAAWYQAGMCLLLLGIVPACLMRFAFGESLKQIGLGRGSVVAAAVLFALTAPFILWISYDCAGLTEFREYYPLNRGAGRSAASFAANAAGLALFYLGWEFHFRGFLQRGLAESIGFSAALWMQVMASGALHFDRPDVELWASIPAALLWGLQSNYTGAIWAGFAQHWLLGITLDYFICFS
jgi:membrane protease YdiL (CAAX protease family)